MKTDKSYNARIMKNARKGRKSASFHMLGSDAKQLVKDGFNVQPNVSQQNLNEAQVFQVDWSNVRVGTKAYTAFLAAEEYHKDKQDKIRYQAKRRTQAKTKHKNQQKSMREQLSYDLDRKSVV